MFAQKTVHTDTHLKNHYFLKLFMFANQIVESAKTSLSQISPLQLVFQEKTPLVDQTPEAQQRRAELRAEAARDLEPRMG